MNAKSMMVAALIVASAGITGNATQNHRCSQNDPGLIAAAPGRRMFTPDYQDKKHFSPDWMNRKRFLPDYQDKRRYLPDWQTRKRTLPLS